MVVEPAEYPTQVQAIAICAYAEKMAKNAWLEAGGPDSKARDDFRKGFIDGYADYVRFGGNGEPPPLPPRCYWAKQTPEGRQQALDWFAGFRQGAALAIQSQARDLILVPPSGPGHVSSDSAVGEPDGRSSTEGALPMPRRLEPDVQDAPHIVPEPAPAPELRPPTKRD
jgi:hypothetical protein